MHLHEELRAARLAGGLTQTELASRAGIPRNQVVRAEKGGNITLDTLRRIAAHLPIQSLTLLEKLKLEFDYIPEPEKLYMGALLNLAHTFEALRSSLDVAMAARLALNAAYRAAPEAETGGARNIDDLPLLKEIEQIVEEVSARLRKIG